MSQERQTPSPEAATAAAFGQVQLGADLRLPAKQRQQFVFRRRVQTQRRDGRQPQTFGRILRTDRKRPIVAQLRWWRQTGISVVGAGSRHRR